MMVGKEIREFFKRHYDGNQYFVDVFKIDIKEIKVKNILNYTHSEANSDEESINKFGRDILY
jgi:hypothetical protein